MKTITDQAGNEIKISREIKSIVSLVPSLTELLFFLKAGDKIQGITDFCVHPEDQVREKKKVGGPMNFDVEAIEQISPDVIITSKGENNKKLVSRLMENFPVFVCDVNSIGEACQAIEKIGIICDQTELAQNLSTNIRQGFDKLATPTNLNVIYLVWEKPYIVAGSHTLIHDVLLKSGINNAFSFMKGYQKVTAKQLLDAKADVVLLPSEPYQFTQHHIEQYKNLLPDAKVILVDGQMFCWYGNRLLLSLNYLKNLKMLLQSICRKSY